MICKECQSAGDALQRAEIGHDDRVISDELSRAKALHALCKDNGCFCQHRVG